LIRRGPLGGGREHLPLPQRVGGGKDGAAAADGDSFVSFTENIRLTRIRTVKSVLGDYTSLAAWEAGGSDPTER